MYVNLLYKSLMKTPSEATKHLKLQCRVMLQDQTRRRLHGFYTMIHVMKKHAHKKTKQINVLVNL